MSVDNRESGVFTEAFGNYNAFGCLIVLKQRSHYARKGESRTIERMTEMGFLVIASVTTFETVSLISFEIGYRRNLEPALLCCRVHLKVESDGGGETHVTSTETENMPRQTELLKQALDVSLHFLKSGIAVFRLLDAYYLYFVELMQTVETSDILAVAAGLTAEACGISAVLYREFIGRNYYIAIEIGDRYFWR